MRADLERDFAAYVGARQHQLLRAAYLVCGDEHLAQDLLQQALIKVAVRWDRLRTENPDAYIRTILYRDAVSSWRKRRHEVVTEVVPESPDHDALDADVARRLDLTRALNQLTPKQRAVVVVRYFDDRSVEETADVLGVSTGTVKSQTYAALERLRAFPWGVGRTRGLSMTPRDLSDRLDEASADLLERDFAGDAWEHARAVRSRRRHLLVAATGAAVAVLVVTNLFASTKPVSGARADQTEGAWLTDSVLAQAVASDGTRIVIGPDGAGLESLPYLETGLPRTLDWERPNIEGTPPSAGRRGSTIVGVLVRKVEPAFEPVLLLAPSGGGPVVYAPVPVTLVPTQPAFSDAPQLNATTISDDRASVVIVQPQDVVVISATGSVLRLPKPADPDNGQEMLLEAGFARDGSIVVNSANQAWSVDPSTGTYSQIDSDGRSSGRILDTTEGQTAVTVYSASGQVLRSTMVDFPDAGWTGSTVTGDEWVARGGYLDARSVPEHTRAFTGLFITSTTDSSNRLLVVMADDAKIRRGARKGAIRAMTWRDAHTVIFQYNYASRSRLLAFNVRSGEFFRVAEIDPMLVLNSPAGAGLELAQFDDAA